MGRSYKEIEDFLRPRVQELAFSDLKQFFVDLIVDGKRLAGDEEVAKLLYETISYLESPVPKKIKYSEFTLKGLIHVLAQETNDKWSKQQLAKGLKIHKQTLNKWLIELAPNIHSKLHQKRKLSLTECYSIIESLGFIESNRIMSRKELTKRCNLRSSELRRNLPDEMVNPFDKFNKYPPVFSNKILQLFDIERNSYLIWQLSEIEDNEGNREKIAQMFNQISSFVSVISNYHGQAKHKIKLQRTG